jgi:hypothetical protein
VRAGAGGASGSTQPAAAAAAEQVVFTPDGRLPRPMKLSLVVKDALRRWYLEAEKEALRGDVVRPADPPPAAPASHAAPPRRSPRPARPHGD